MTPIETDIEQYLLWLGVHNYAKTTAIENRRRYLGYLAELPRPPEGHRRGRGWSPTTLLKAYQERSLCPPQGETASRSPSPPRPQRLIPVQQFFTWLRRSGRIQR